MIGLSSGVEAWDITFWSREYGHSAVQGHQLRPLSQILLHESHLQHGSWRKTIHCQLCLQPVCSNSWLCVGFWKSHQSLCEWLVHIFKKKPLKDLFRYFVLVCIRNSMLSRMDQEFRSPVPQSHLKVTPVVPIPSRKRPARGGMETSLYLLVQDCWSCQHKRELMCTLFQNFWGLPFKNSPSLLPHSLKPSFTSPSPCMYMSLIFFTVWISTTLGPRMNTRLITMSECVLPPCLLLWVIVMLSRRQQSLTVKSPSNVWGET